MAHPGFIVEFNRPTNYGRNFGAQLAKLGFRAKRLPHKTAWLLRYDGSFTKHKVFQQAVAQAVQAGGSALAISLKTRHAYVLSKQAFGFFKVKQVA